MKENIQKHSDYIAAAFVIAVLGVSIAFGIVPLVEKIRDERRMIETDYIAQGVRLQRIAKKEYMQKERALIEENDAFLPDIPTESQIIAMVEMLENSAQERNVQVRFAAMTDEQERAVTQKMKMKMRSVTQSEDNSDTQQAPPTATESEKHFMVTFTGTYRDVIAMMYILENAPYYVFIDTVTITPQRNVRGRGSDVGVVLATPRDTESKEKSEDKKYVIATMTVRIPFAQEKNRTR